LCACAITLLTLGCVANPAIKESQNLFAEGRYDDSVLRLETAMRDTPDDHVLRTQYFRQRDMAISQLLAQAQTERAARRLTEAQAIYQRVQRLDPNNLRVREGLADMAAQQRHEVAVLHADALLGKNDISVAEKLLRGVLAENPAHGDARRLLQKTA
jgi:general secretion pathway protein D